MAFLLSPILTYQPVGMLSSCKGTSTACRPATDSSARTASTATIRCAHRLSLAAAAPQFSGVRGSSRVLMHGNFAVLAHRKGLAVLQNVTGEIAGCGDPGPPYDREAHLDHRARCSQLGEPCGWIAQIVLACEIHMQHGASPLAARTKKWRLSASPQYSPARKRRELAAVCRPLILISDPSLTYDVAIASIAVVATPRDASKQGGQDRVRTLSAAARSSSRGAPRHAPRAEPVPIQTRRPGSRPHPERSRTIFIARRSAACSSRRARSHSSRGGPDGPEHQRGRAANVR
jgi:hypothetical protein